MRNIQYFILLCVFAGAIYSCKTNDALQDMETPDMFYPLEVGKYIDYSVDSIIYHETISTDTSHYEVREMLADTFYDNEQRLNYKIERYQRPDDTTDWTLVNVWSVLSTGGQIQKVENNLRFIKLVTPVLNDTHWSGNAYLGGLDDLPYDEECNRLTFLEGWDYSYANTDQPYSLNGFDFDKTLKVIQDGDSNFIWYNYAEEIYAQDLGLVSKTFIHYYTQDTGCPDCPWEERVQCGYSIQMNIIDHN